jgi:hypothetical protein
MSAFPRKKPPSVIKGLFIEGNRAASIPMVTGLGQPSRRLKKNLKDFVKFTEIINNYPAIHPVVLSFRREQKPEGSGELSAGPEQ